MIDNISWSAGTHLALRNSQIKPTPGRILSQFIPVHNFRVCSSKNHSKLRLPQGCLADFYTKPVFHSYFSTCVLTTSLIPQRNKIPAEEYKSRRYSFCMVNATQINGAFEIIRCSECALWLRFASLSAHNISDSLNGFSRNLIVGKFY